MKIFFLSVVTALAIQSSFAHADESPDDMLNAFSPLISKVRGAIRYQLEQGKGCLPWASLAIDPDDQKTSVDFGFTPEQVKQLGGASAPTIGALLATVANKKPFTFSAIGTCEMDSTIGKGTTPNVITLVLERRSGSAIRMRFPFEQNSHGQVSYIKSKMSIEQATPLVFVQPISEEMNGKL